MTECVQERTNDEWLADLRDGALKQSDALRSLRERTKRSIYYYLSQERSDLRALSPAQLDQMADDLAQDATLRVLANLDNFRGESNLQRGPTASPRASLSVSCGVRATATSASTRWRRKAS